MEINKIYTHSLILWKDVLVKPISDKLLRIAFNLITDERNGKDIDNSLIKYTIRSYNSSQILSYAMLEY